MNRYVFGPSIFLRELNTLQKHVLRDFLVFNPLEVHNTPDPFIPRTILKEEYARNRFIGSVIEFSKRGPYVEVIDDNREQNTTPLMISVNRRERDHRIDKPALVIRGPMKGLRGFIKFINGVGRVGLRGYERALFECSCNDVVLL